MINKYETAERDALSFSKLITSDMTLAGTAPMMTSPSFIDRFRAEYCQLIIRVHKLKIMLTKLNAGQLEVLLRCPASLLEEQFKVMIRYAQILEYRAVIENINLADLSAMRRDWNEWLKRCQADIQASTALGKRCDQIEDNLKLLQSGALGDITSSKTLLKYWRMQESAGYPMASENIKYFEEMVRKEKRENETQNEQALI